MDDFIQKHSYMAIFWGNHYVSLPKRNGINKKIPSKITWKCHFGCVTDKVDNMKILLSSLNRDIKGTILIY